MYKEDTMTAKEHSTLAVAIVDAMNDALPVQAFKSWKLIPHETYTEVQGVKGEAFTLHFEGYGNIGKVRINGSFPRTNDGDYIDLPRETAHPEIKCALTRGAAIIAKEITRRFMPEYMPVLAAIQKRKQDADDYAAKQKANTVELMAAFDEKIKDNDRSKEAIKDGHFYVGSHRTYYGEVRVTATSADLTLRSLPIAIAQKIAAILTALPRRNDQ